ncbi:MAG TPA: biosynthetic peptidoglycan transglycosylase [Spirochaetia bacterium]|nr:biosynthetic peptidoglycan transglycosylase [Spirochaetia bacterium]
MKKRSNLCRFMVVVVLALLAVWGGWQSLVARTGPAVLQLPSLVHSRLAAHGAAYVPLTVMPLALRDAVVATEDRQFWTNPGIDLEGIVRSALVDAYYGQFVQGGSTITQQLARDMLLNPHKTLGRKIKEMLLALVITRNYSKEAILEMYLNEIYLGHGAYGVGSAARVYFGVAPERLTEAQCVMLAGVPRGPSLYDPLVNWQAARNRQRQVLDNMVEAGYLTAARANQIYAQPLGLSRG